MAPLDSSLFLTGSDSLKLSDFIYGDIHVASSRLAVLSACQTGLAEFARIPDEAIGFPAALIQAGVPAVIGTLWPVEDISTALLLSTFYQLHASEGLAPAIALQAAQVWLRDSTAAELRLAEHYQALWREKPRSIP